MSRPLIAAGLAIIAPGVVVLLVAAIQRHLKQELGRTNEQVVKLEKVIGNLKMELDAENKARTQLEGHLNEANSDNDHRRQELDTAQSESKEKDARAQELTDELEKARKEAERQLAAQTEASQLLFLRHGLALWLYQRR